MKNTDQPLVSIAIPFFNAEKYLSKAIESVIQQTYNNWELILLNDGSTDSSMAIAERFKNIDDRIMIYNDGFNRNLGYRLNQIPSIVKGVYLCRMDADDIMHPRKIESQIKFLLDNKEVDILGTNAYSIDEEDLVQGIRYNIQSGLLNDVKSFIHPTIMGKTDWFKNNPYDVNAVRIEDAELWLRTHQFSNFKILGEPLFFYREFGTEYYKKYIKGIPSLYYLIKKHSYHGRVMSFSIKYFLATMYMYFYFLFGKESIPIKKRNSIRFKEHLHYSTFL